ncbi:hypothetical protein [Amazonocrinis nigriterrae]|nr:hypothetical protein [Amazonocrinis nigriterrae]
MRRLGYERQSFGGTTISLEPDVAEITTDLYEQVQFGTEVTEA